MALAIPNEPGQTPLDADELAQLIPRHIATQGQLNEWEQQNILEALKWLQRGRRPAVLTEAFCRALHKRMFGKTWRWAGNFRQSNKNLGCDWRQVPVRLRQLLDNTQFWLNDQVFELDELAVRFHHQLVVIHAFPSGNGRHARLMTDCLLREAGARPFCWGNEADLAVGDVRKAYLDALRAADAGDIAKLANFVRS